MARAKLLQAIGEQVLELVEEHLDELRAHTRKGFPRLQRWGTGKEEGIMLSQGLDEIWLTPTEARRLIKELRARYPMKH